MEGLVRMVVVRLGIPHAPHPLPEMAGAAQGVVRRFELAGRLEQGAPQALELRWELKEDVFRSVVQRRAV